MIRSIVSLILQKVFSILIRNRQKISIISDFEKNKSKHIERNINHKITTVNYSDRKFQGILEVRKTNKFIVLNGHHRLAILKAFKGLKIKKIDDKILTKFFCNSLKYLKVLVLFTYAVYNHRVKINR